MMEKRPGFFVLAVSILLHAGLLKAAGKPYEGGVEYWTDSHAAGAAAHALLELGDGDPESVYTRYGKGALDWLIAVANRHGSHGCSWYLSMSAPKGHAYHKVTSIPGTAYIAKVFLLGYAKTGDEKYRKAGLDAVRWLVEQAMLRENTELGEAVGVMHRYNPANQGKPFLDKGISLVAGNSHGLGTHMETLSAAYQVARDEAFKEEIRAAMKGILVTLRIKAVVRGDPGKPSIAWSTRKARERFETGFCYGQAGLAKQLFDAYTVFPDIKLKDGTTMLDLANGSLRYLMNVAVELDGTISWSYMRHHKDSKNPGYGSGTGGIGWAFLKGAEVNRGPDPDFSDQCLAYAQGAARFGLHTLLATPMQRKYTKPGGDFGFGLCGGMGGMGHFLFLYADYAKDANPAFSGALLQGIRRLGEEIIAASTRYEGCLVWPDMVNFQGHVNMALDYGQTGIVLMLDGYGEYLRDERFRIAANGAGDFIVKHAVAEGGGYKFPRLVAYCR